MITYLYCDNDAANLGVLLGDTDLVRPNQSPRLRPWRGDPTGTRRPEEALRRFGGALREASNLPDVVLIDDWVEFSEHEATDYNGLRTMAGFRRLLDQRPPRKPPAFVLLSYMAPDVNKCLTFMEFGGTAIADRQTHPGAKALMQIITAAVHCAPTDPPLWCAPEPKLGMVHGNSTFWSEQFPLLPLLDDGMSPARIATRLGIGGKNPKREVSSRKSELRKHVTRAFVASGTEVKGDFEGDDWLVEAAMALGLVWITEKGRRDSFRLPWRDPAPLRLRSDRDPAVRAHWYRACRDPRAEHGASTLP